MRFSAPILAVVLGVFLLGCKSKSGSSAEGDNDKPADKPTAPTQATCVAPTGLPDDLALPPDAKVTKAENYHWDWNVKYEVTDSAAEFERLLAERKARGWTVLSARDESQPGDLQLSAFAYRGNQLIQLVARRAGQQTDLDLSYGLFPRDIGALVKVVYLPDDARLRNVEWTTTLHDLLFVFDSSTSATDYTAKVEAHLKSLGWTTTRDERDTTYKNRDTKLTVGLRNSDEVLGIFVSDAACRNQQPK